MARLDAAKTIISVYGNGFWSRIFAEKMNGSIVLTFLLVPVLLTIDCESELVRPTLIVIFLTRYYQKGHDDAENLKRRENFSFL